MTPVTIPDSESAILRSSKSGRAYQIQLAYPAGETPGGGFPVLYLIDGHKFFGTLVESVRTRCHRPDATGVSPAAIVGISPQPADNASRSFDYTPGPSKGSRETGGGAGDFLTFIEDDLKPWIGRKVSVDESRHVLFGHSLGGYLVLHALLTRPEMFHAYVAISPSLWWDRELLFSADFSRLRDAAETAGGRRVMITVGEFEQPKPSGETATAETHDRHRQRRMIDNARDFADRLRALRAPALDVRFHEFAGEDHASNVTVTIGKSLRFVLAPR